ncbi:MAG: hypothetical protein CME64_08120 [Halobacteriovoraceae bacterium]|nr:hypothetical protein [Halobacteriovoraceae bacterium]|tara:strand:+ start:173423 stop:174037 length:615 start_codon:yes stop_codon:yes gene_type:complete
MLLELLKKELSYFTERQYKRNQIIYNEGDAPDGLYFIESGIIGLFHVSESGHETLLRVFSKNYIFGHRSLIAQENYHASSICLTPSRIYHISSSKFKELYTRNPEVLFEISKILAKELRASELRLSGLQDKSANRRIVESLVYLKLKHPNYTWTRKEIAEFAGSTFESVVRVMTGLQDLGLIEKKGRDFQVFDFEKMIDHSTTL